MPLFQYTARTPTGQRTQGAVEAASEAAAIRLLDEQRLFPIRVSEQAQEKGRSATGGVRARDLATLFEQLADLLHAGVPMLRAIETLSRTHTKGRLHAVLAQVQAEVAEGKALSDAMADQPAVFNGLQVAMVRAGERGGFLEEVLMSLAGYLERQDELRAKVQGAMIYPALLVVIGASVVLGLLVWMVPKFQVFFEGMELPLPSRILFAASDAVVHYWPTTLAVGFLAAVGIGIFLGSDAGRETWARWQLRIPVIGHTLLMVSLTRFCRILGTMLASGVPILQALTISRDAVGTPRLAAAIDEAVKSVREGQGLTAPLRRSALVPEQILEMMAVAEESNQLEKVLLKVADAVERRTNQAVDAAVRLLEPLILTVLALIVLVVAMGLLYPIFTMARSIR
jgi:general secretion pathway protein F